GNPDALKTALREFRQMEQRLSRDFGVLPDRDVRELIEGWQSRVNDAGEATTPDERPTEVAPALPVAPAAVPAPRARRRAFALASVAAAAVVVAAVVWFNRKPAALKSGEFVLLSEFANHTTDSMLTRSIGTAVAAALRQSAHVVPLPRSRVTSALVR